MHEATVDSSDRQAKGYSHGTSQYVLVSGRINYPSDFCWDEPTVWPRIFDRFVAVFPKYSSPADSPTYNYSTYKIDVLD